MVEIRYSDPQTCRHCGNMGPMRIAGNVADTICDPELHGQEHGTIYEVLTCSKCGEPTMRAGLYYDGMEEEDWAPGILYPAEAKRLSSLPPKVQTEYESALEASRLTSPNAYAVMLGRVLDAVCEDRGAVGETLNKRLLDLADRGEIPRNLAGIAQNMRQFRNVGAHADLGSLTKAEIPFLESLSNAILEYLYEAPRLVQAAQARYVQIKSK